MSAPPAGLQWIAIVAATPGGVIGRDGQMPWQLSSDLRRFKKLTMGCPLVMGRKTFESIGRPLPGRRNLVLSRSLESSEGAELCDSIETLDAAVRAETRVFVIGGATLYRELLPRCQYLLLTRVWSQVEGDTTLELDLSAYFCTLASRLPQSPRDSVPTEFEIWRRVD
jgi:dihydrofolate reductase